MTPTPTLRLRQAKSVARRHPWVFSGAIERVDGDPGPGDTVLVRGPDGAALGWAAYSPASQIRARMWTFDADAVVTDEYVANAVAAAVARRTLWVGTPSDSMRLVFSEADAVPGLVADRYADTVVCQFTTAGAERWRGVLADALMAVPGVARVYERGDADSRAREGLEDRSGPVRGDAPPVGMVAHEGAWQFEVDPVGGHKTGFYLDQRDGRAAVAAVAAGRRVLDVCCYTGSLGIAAASAGASSVTRIDSSAAALAVAARNAARNGVDAGESIEGDAFTVLRGLRDRARSFDLVLLDPPKLAATQAQVERATRAYKDLNLLALKLLAPGGLLCTWSCSGAMTAELFQKVVAGAALDAKREARIVGRLHQPFDHPVPLSFPEAEYLKGLMVAVD